MAVGLPPIPENNHDEPESRSRDELGLWRRWSVKEDEPTLSGDPEVEESSSDARNSVLTTRTSWLLDSDILDLESNRNSVSSVSTSIISRCNSGGREWFMRLAGEGKIIHQEIIMEEQRPRPRTPAPEEMRRNARHALEANSPIRAGPSRYHTRVDSHQAGPSTSQHHSKDFHTRSSRTAPAPPESIVSPAPGMPATPRNGVSTKRLSWADTTLPPRRKRWYETPNKPASFSFKMLPRSRMMTNPSNSGSVPVSSRVGSNSTSVGSATRGEGAGIASDFPLDEHALGKVIASLVSLLPDVPEKDSGKPVSYAIVPRKESGCWVATAHKKDALSERTQVDGRTQFKISLR